MEIVRESGVDGEGMHIPLIFCKGFAKFERFDLIVGYAKTIYGLKTNKIANMFDVGEAKTDFENF